MKEKKSENLKKYLDKSVTYLLLSIFFVSASALTYRVYSDFPCENINFDIKGKEYRVGELIKFTDITERAQKWQWNFGDSSAVSSSRESLHIYKKPGEYTVTLKVNNSCEKTQIITIKEKKFVLDPNKIPKLIVQDSITVGETITLTDSTKDAYTWEWRFGETAKVNATTQKATYAYSESGLKTITLVVNGDIRHMAKKRIKVYPKKKKEDTQIDNIQEPDKGLDWDIPYQPNEKEKKDKEEKPEDEAPYISEPAFEKKLMKLSDKKLSEKSFKEYFCGDINKNIVVNGKNITFLVFCKKIRGKNINIKRLNIYRNEGSNCIENMNIEYKKKVFF